MRTADENNWSLNTDQVLDLAESLSSFFVNAGQQIKSEATFPPDCALHFSAQMSSPGGVAAASAQAGQPLPPPPYPFLAGSGAHNESGSPSSSSRSKTFVSLY